MQMHNGELLMKEIAKALNKAQSIMSGARKDKTNPHFRSSYADLASVFDAIREPFAENGLAVSQPIETLENGRMVVVTKLMHISGEILESRMLLPNIDSPQKLGSAITYWRRYSLMSIAGVPAEDDDGNLANENAPKPIEKISADQGAWVMNQINGNREALSALLKPYEVSSIYDVPKSCWPEICQRINAMNGG
jgi:hypothetical protein